MKKLALDDEASFLYANCDKIVPAESLKLECVLFGRFDAAVAPASAA